MIDTLNRLLKFREDTQDMIKLRKKEKYLQELSTLTDKPTISPNSKKLVTHNQMSHMNSPLYIRYQLELKAKESRIKHLMLNKSQEEEKSFSKTCTFSPNKIKNPERTHEVLVDSCMKWKDRKKLNLQGYQEKRIKQEMKGLKSRPDISENSKKLTQKVRFIQRSLTPVLTRLTATKSFCSPPKSKSPYLKSNISENSKKIISQKTPSPKPTYTKPKTPCEKCKKVPSASPNTRSKSSLPRDHTLALNESFIKFHQLSDFSKSFKINSSRSAVNKVDINYIDFNKFLEIASPSKSKD